MKPSVNIQAVDKELPFPPRFAAAKRDGFVFVEIWDWDSKDVDELCRVCKAHDIEISGMGRGGPVSLCDPARKETRFKISVPPTLCDVHRCKSL